MVEQTVGQVFDETKRPIFILFLVLLIIAILIPVFTYAHFAADLKDKQRLINANDTGLTLLDRNGKTFFTFYNAKNEDYVSLSLMSKSVQHAVIAGEDKNFYTNPGFSIPAIIRALLVDISAGKIKEGGSTISQGLIKISLLNSERSFLRKYQEISLAVELNKQYSKDEILEMYLNSVYFGEGAFGVENAAQSYFGVHAKDLSLAQSALLAGLLPAPSALSPISNNPERAIKNQKIILTQMVENGFITRRQASDAENEKLVFNSSPRNINNHAHHFAFYVRDELVKKYGEETVIRSGFKVTTTLNSDWQKYAEETVRNQVAQLNINGATNGSAVVLDPKTGEILVMVGSFDWNDKVFGKVNMATSPRQVGSSFKPIIYSKAFEERIITPSSILQDTPRTYPPDNYRPRNYDGRFRGPVTVRRALANSLNVPAVQVMQQVGIPNGLEMARRLGITTLENDSDYGLSFVLGAGEVKLLELTNVYATLANSGKYNSTLAVLKVQDKYGKVLNTVNFQSENVIGEDVSFLITSILSDHQARTEAFGNLLNISRPAAVKTGTTNDYKDALTLGYTPSLTVGVWVGNNDNAPMDNIAGSLGAAPIWKNLMETFLSGTPVETFSKPPSVVQSRICPNISRGRTTTSSGSVEYYLAGTEPQSPCIAPRPSLRTPFPRQKPTNEPNDSIPQPSPTPFATPTPQTPVPTRIIFPEAFPFEDD